MQNSSDKPNKDKIIDESLITRRIAANLVYYRKLHNMTQAALAERIKYSDKSISKWERGVGVPDIFVLSLLAEFYNVTVNDLVSENAPLPPAPTCDLIKKRIIIMLLSVGLAWLVATVAYTVLRIVIPGFEYAWGCFIVAIPVSCIICVVFCALWWSILFQFLSVSALVWAVAISVYILVPLYSIYLIFAVSAVMQILVLLWYMMKKPTRRHIVN